MVNEKTFEQILEICRLLNQKQMLAAGDGNISYRLDENRIAITPTGVNKAFLRKDGSMS